jgi:hypothetical protein
VNERNKIHTEIASSIILNPSGHVISVRSEVSARSQDVVVSRNQEASFVLVTGTVAMELMALVLALVFLERLVVRVKTCVLELQKILAEALTTGVVSTEPTEPERAGVLFCIC